MSLKALHICFIVLSVLLAMGFGVWAIQNYQSTQEPGMLVLGGASWIGAVGLVAYLFLFLAKMKRARLQ